MSRAFLLLGVTATVGVIGLACSASNDDTASAAGASGTGGVPGTGGVGGDGMGGTFAAMSSGGGGMGIGGGCAGETFKADPIPLDIFIMLDQSGSMLQGAGNNMSRWDTVKAALAAFVQEPTAAGIGLGIQYFGLPQPLIPGCAAIRCTQDSDCTGGCGPCAPQGICLAPFNPDIDSCDPTDYAWADVGILPLPGVGNAILASMGAHAPGTNTPTAPAVQGAIDYAKKWASLNPTHVTVVAFASDGDPSECDTDLDHINAMAAAGFAGVPSIQTFVIGVGPSLQALDDLAAAGGTTKAFHVDLDPMATELFVGAMNTIRLAAIGCTYKIPAPPRGRMEDFGLVNVKYTPGDGSPPETIPKVENLLQCPADGSGWYYDDNANPTQIILCGSTCDRVSTDLMAQVDIVLGCQTIVK